jgi:hypothetical protein
MQRNQTGTFSIIIAAIVVVAAFLLVMSATPPLADDNTLPAAQGLDQGLYNPARVALINARQQLSESLRQEEDILEQVRRVHKELDASLALLASAEQIDPTMKAPIEALRAQLSALENDPSVAEMDSETLRSTYQRLLAEFEALIERY